MKYISREQLCYLNCHYVNYSIDYFLDTMAMLGVPYVELSTGHQGVWLDHKSYCNVNELKRKLTERGLGAKIIAPENCVLMYQYAAPEKELFDLCYRYFANGMRMGAELGCTLMECNSGWGYWNEDIVEGQKRCIDMFQRLVRLAEELDMVLVCESLRPQETRIGDTLEKTKFLYDSVGSDRLKIMIDLTAMSVSGETLQQWFDVFGGAIIHMHFQDRTPMGHLIWGDGNCSLEENLRILKENGYTGLLSSEITHARYYMNPRYYDTINVRNLERFM